MSTRWSGPAPLRAHDAPWRRLAGSTAARPLAWTAAMLLAAAACAAVLEPSWRAEAAALDARAAAQRPHAATTPGPPLAREPAWPHTDAHAARIGALLALARRHGVEVRVLQDDRRADALDAVAGAAGIGDGGATVAWRGIVLGAEGGYEALRRFAESALLADPALALDSLVLQRGALDAATLSADFGFALGHRPDTGGDGRRSAVEAPRDRDAGRSG